MKRSRLLLAGGLVVALLLAVSLLFFHSRDRDVNAWNDLWIIDELATHDLWLETEQGEDGLLAELAPFYQIEINFGDKSLIERIPPGEGAFSTFTWQRLGEDSIRLEIESYRINRTMIWSEYENGTILQQVPDHTLPDLVLVRQSQNPLVLRGQELYGPYSGQWQVADLPGFMEALEQQGERMNENEQTLLKDLLIVADFSQGRMEEKSLASEEVYETWDLRPLLTQEGEVIITMGNKRWVRIQDGKTLVLEAYGLSLPLVRVP